MSAIHGGEATTLVESNPWAEVVLGLSGQPKSLPPKFFYDARGSQLFDAICRTPEYYVYRTERALLARHAGEIADLIGSGSVIVEPGSGSCEKIELLLDAVRPTAYVPIEICSEHSAMAAQRLLCAYPWLNVQPVCGDFTALGGQSIATHCVRHVVFFPGSTLGNFEPQAAQRLLAHMTGWAGKGGGILIGIDLKKSTEVLHAAYNDAAGLTAAFNLNVLHHLNREFDGNFRIDDFRHHAAYNRERGRVEMHLVSRTRQNVRLRDQWFPFESGESIHTENSYKYTVGEFQALARHAGVEPVRVWVDEEKLFSLHYLAVPEAP